MRLLLFALTLPFFASALHLSRREHPPPSSLVIASRQHRIPRAIIDLCINLDVDLLAEAAQLGLIPLLGPLGLGFKFSLCLCLKDLDIYLATNIEIKALVGLLGKNTVSAIITAIINTSPNAATCSLPPNAHRTCNNVDPCHYACDPHYTLVGNTCVCAPPYTLCNGKCDIFTKPCGSAVPRSFNVRSEPIITIAQAKAACKPHETVCGIPGREDTLDFECIDIRTAKDSCGGCMAPQPFFEANSGLHVSGTDCTRIPKAKISQCSARRCVVTKCKAGWIPNQAQDACILDSHGHPKLRKVLKRQGPLALNATADVNSDLLAKVGAIVNLVSGLNISPSKIPANPSSLPVVIPVLLNDVNNATSTLIASTTVPSLLNNLEALLNVSSLLSSTIASGTDLGYTNLEATLNNIVAALLNLKNWSANTVLTGLNLPGSLSGLTLNKPTAAVGAVVNSDLVDQIKSLVGLVVDLAGVSASLPSPSPGSGSVPTSPSSINTNIVNSIINATVDIVTAPTVNSLISGVDGLVNVNDLASNLLDQCGCVTALGLGTLVANLARVVIATREMKDWCDTYPVASIPRAPATPIFKTDELPINVGLSDLLGSLEPIEGGAAVSGLRATTGTLVNGLLGSLGSKLLTVTAAGGVLNPELVTQLEGLTFRER